MVKEPDAAVQPVLVPCSTHVPRTVPPLITEPVAVPVTLVLVSVSVLPFAVTVKENVLSVSWSAELILSMNVPLGVAPVTGKQAPWLLFRN
jgi:hypothetical protein